MKILYCALAVDIGGAHGGATHVAEVTNGLAALGHDLWVIGRGNAASPVAALNARITRLSTPPKLAWLMTPTIRRIAGTWQPDVVMERFYTFAGGGIAAAHRAGLPALLEVNAPVTDPPGSRKETLDRLAGHPMRRWATQQCRWADRIVTPLATTVPEEVRPKVDRLDWGANIEAFDPERYPRTGQAVLALRSRYRIPDGAPVVGFVGSFRPWHGAMNALHAFRAVRDAVPNARLLLVGDGPERAEIAAAAGDRDGVIFTGAVPYADIPAHLALCDVAVAPFVPRLHAPLEYFGFYWSPLKVFEAMAMAVPVVTTAVQPLIEIIDGAGASVPEGDVPALANAIIGILHNEPARVAMGAHGRKRVIEQWSWQAHCRQLDRIITAMVTAR